MFPKPQKGTAKRTRRTTRRRSERSFRDAVWAGRYYATCERCKRLTIRGVSGEVDHIQPRSTHPELAFDPANGRIVCFECNRYLKTHPLER